MDARIGAKRVAVLIPAYNEEKNIAAVLADLFCQLSGLPYRFRVILVDDGSEDGTVDAARSAKRGFPLTIIRLSRNFGKEAAILAGLDTVNDDAVVIMDADLQHPVELVPKFLAKWEDGFQNIYGVKKDRHAEPWFKAPFVKLFYRAINHRGDVYIEPNALDFRLLDRCVVEALRAVRERVRFTKGLYAWVGFRSTGIVFTPHARLNGQSHFDRFSLRRLGWDGLTSFSDFPLRLAAVLGCSISFASMCYGIYIAVRTFLFGVDVPGWATLTVALTMLGGMQLLFLGLAGAYLRNIFVETKQRPSYVVAEVLAENVNAAVQPDTRSARSAVSLSAKEPVLARGSVGKAAVAPIS